MRKGLTLIELIITTALIAILTVVMALIFRAILISWSAQETRAGIDIGLDRGIEEMVRDLREAQAITSVNNDEIRFTTANGTNYIYYLYNANDPYPPGFNSSLLYELRKATLSGGISGTFTYGSGDIIISDVVPPGLGTKLCCSVLEGGSCTVICSTGIIAVKYVKYGASGCANLSSCDSANGANCTGTPSCVGATSCSWTFNNTNCSETCPGWVKTGYLTITCGEFIPNSDLSIDGNIVTIELGVKRKDEMIGSKTQVRPRNLCGGTLQVAHLASGGVAPVDKTVTYGTILTSISGASKCWITQNLGATNQASSATDGLTDQTDTHDVAGWYWQFNRKQGYQYTTTRTPNTASWITIAPTDGNWTADNDPCTLLLGTGWRLPTATEWSSADNAPENWWNYTDTYASVLKLHAAGYLFTNNGILASRGSEGYYWSSTQQFTSYGYSLYFVSSASGLKQSDKAAGFSVRCLKNLE